MNISKGMYIIHLNIRSLQPKIDLLRTWLTYNKPKVITFSETWLNSTISDDDIKLDNYVLYRADRNSRGGGVATYISSTLVSELVTPKENPLYFEFLFVKIILHKNKQLIIGNIYRPPKALVESTKGIISTINSLDDHTEMILLGDFNNNWLVGSCRYDRNLFSSSNLTQLITEPTRTDSNSSSLPDWILVTHPDRIISSGVLPDSFSDHSMIYCVWKINILRLPPKLIRVRQ